MTSAVPDSTPPTRRILLADGTNLVTRAHFGFGSPPRSQLGRLTLGMLRDAAVALEATHLIVALDHPAETFRRALASDYKGTRKTKPDAVNTRDLVDAARPMFAAANVHMVEAEGFEADDCLATLAVRLAPTATVMILSADKDLHAVVSDQITVFGFSGQKGARGLDKYMAMTPQAVEAKHGLAPSQLADAKALSGETGDNIAGVPGIGVLRALEIIQLHGSLAAALQAAPLAAKGSATARLVGQDAAAELGRQLATLRLDVPLAPIRPKGCAVSEIDWTSPDIAIQIAVLAAQEASARPVVSGPDVSDAAGDGPQRSGTVVSLAGAAPAERTVTPLAVPAQTDLFGELPLATRGGAPDARKRRQGQAAA